MLGRKPRIVPDHSLMDGINAARISIPLARFDAARCARGIECLRSYQAEWEAHFPKHDFASHAADAWRYLAMAWKEPVAAWDAQPDPIKEILKPRSWNDLWRMHTDEQYEAGADDLPDYAHEFNLNNAAD